MRLHDDKGDFIATGYVNSKSQIMLRLLSWDESQPIDTGFFRERTITARRLRELLPGLRENSQAYRLFFGESDGIPGLVVDKYGSFLVVQIQTLGMHLRREAILDILEEIYSPQGIFDRSDPEMLEREGYSSPGGTLRGEEPPEQLVLEIDGITFAVDLHSGQKTGLFLDQRENRKAAAGYAAGRRVLDCFCHTGGFGLYAAKAGAAASVLGIDSSENALELARQNAERNSLTNIEFRNGKLPDELRTLRDQQQVFDMVILDPPQYAKSKALRCTAEDGIFVTCSCSQHVTDDMFEQMLNEAAFEAKRTVQMLERRTQAPDHPVIASCAETRYLDTSSA